MTSPPRLAFVTNLCPHYRVRTYETFAKRYDVDYFFFSADNDWYWPAEHGTQAGDFRHRYLPGVRIGRVRITPTLPLLLWRGGYDAYIKCINGKFALPVTYLAARLARRPFILWTGIWMRIDTPLHRLLFPLTRFVYRHADAIVVYGDHVKRYLETEGVPAERIFVAPHAVDNSAYDRAVDDEEIAAVRKALGVPPGTKVVLFIGRLEPEKGLSYLVEAFAALRRTDSILVLAGTGSERAGLQAQADALGVSDRVRFPGYIAAAQTTPLYAAAEVYVLPSVTTPRVKEAWGLVVNEAFNQGLPVVSTDAVGAAAGGFVQDGVNGYVVPERDSAALAEALRRILDDPELRAAMGRNARAAVAGLTNDDMIAGFTRAVEYAINSARRRELPR